MKCPKCGSEDFAYVETTNVILRKKLPVWVTIVLFVLALFFFSQIQGNTENLTWQHISGYLCLACLISGIIYTTIRKRRINKDRQKTITKKICTQCNHIEYIE